METEQQHFISFIFLAIAVSYRHRKLNDNPSDHQLSIPSLQRSTYIPSSHTYMQNIHHQFIN